MSPKRNPQTPFPRLIVVSAPSGAGKTTLCELLLKEFPQITVSISATTRPMRAHEVNGVHYHFLSNDEFKKKLDEKAFIEWAEVHGNRYGTLRETVDRNLRGNKHVLFVIDVQGAMNLLRIYQERVLLIFIEPPSMEELEKRLHERKGDSARAIERRIRNAYNELGWSHNFDYRIVNDELASAFQRLKDIIQRECL